MNVCDVAMAHVHQVVPAILGTTNPNILAQHIGFDSADGGRVGLMHAIRTDVPASSVHHVTLGTLSTYAMAPHLHRPRPSNFFRQSSPANLADSASTSPAQTLRWR